MASGDKTVWAWGSNTYGQLGKGVGVKMNAKPAMISGISRIVQVKAGSMQSLGLRTDGSIYMWGTTYLGEPAADAQENYADEDGYYRYEEPLRMRVIYYDEEREEDRALILLNAVQLSCGDEHSVAVAGGQIYAWGNSSLMTVRQKDQLWRLNAQVYDGMNVIAAYAGRERDIYALDAAGDLWNVGAKGKTRIISLK